MILILRLRRLNCKLEDGKWRAWYCLAVAVLIFVRERKLAYPCHFSLRFTIDKVSVNITPRGPAQQHVNSSNLAEMCVQSCVMVLDGPATGGQVCCATKGTEQFAGK